MTRTLLIAANALGAGSVLLAYLLGGRVWPALAFFLLFGLWIFAFIRRWTWTATLSLFVTFGFIAAGFFLDLPPVLLFLGAFLSLAAWDLAGLDAHLRLVDPGNDTALMERRHLQRLGLVLVAGAAVCGLALSLRLRLSFEWIAVLSVLAAWGVGRLTQRLLKKE